MRFPLLLFFAREGGNEDTIPGWGGGERMRNRMWPPAFSSYITGKLDPLPLGKGGDMSSTCSDDAVVVRGGSFGAGWSVQVEGGAAERG